MISAIRQDIAYKLAIPARLTAELTALTADCIEFNSWERSPVAPGMRLCSASTKRVSVMQFVSMGEFDIVFVVIYCNNNKLN